MMSARRTSAARSRVPVVAERDRRVLATTRQQQSDRATDCDASSDYHHVRACNRDLVAAQEMQDSARGARQRGFLAQHQSTEVDRVQAVGVLVGVDALEGCVLVKVLGKRQLHDVAGALGIDIELVDRRVELLLRDVGRQVASQRIDADLGAVVVLAAHVSADPGSSPTRMVPKAGCDALCLQSAHPHLQVFEDFVAGSFAVEDRLQSRRPLFQVRVDE